MPMSLSHKSVKKHNKKLPANVTKNKILDFFSNQGTSSKIGQKARKCRFVKRKEVFNQQNLPRLLSQQLEVLILLNLYQKYASCIMLILKAKCR